MSAKEEKIIVLKSYNHKHTMDDDGWQWMTLHKNAHVQFNTLPVHLMQTAYGTSLKPSTQFSGEYTMNQSGLGHSTFHCKLIIYKIAESEACQVTTNDDFHLTLELFSVQ